MNVSYKVSGVAYGPDDITYMKGYINRRTNLFQRVFRKVYNNTIVKYKYINIVSKALKMGYRIVDFSASYGDCGLIAKAIEKSKIERENITIVTRISNKAQLGNKVEVEFENQLKGFNTDYVDVLMFHWPVTDYYEQTWMKILELKKKGKVKVAGVANCNVHHLERLYEVSGVYPEVNQVEIHPLFTQKELRDFCFAHNIKLQAYSPTARHDDRLYNPKLLKSISAKYGKSITQIILKWHLQNGITPVVRSMNFKHLMSNIDIDDFEISDEDMKKIDSLNINSRMRYDPDNCDFYSL